MRVMRLLFAALVGLLLGGLVHIATLLAIPVLAPQDAYARLVPLGPPNTFHELPPATSGDIPLPFLDPSFVHLACRYDLSGGPVRVRVPVGPSYVSTSLHSRDGVAFFAVNDRSAQRGAVEILIESAGQSRGTSQSDQNQTVTATTPTGFVLVRALIEKPSLREEVLGPLRAARCEPAPPP